VAESAAGFGLAEGSAVMIGGSALWIGIYFHDGGGGSTWGGDGVFKIGSGEKSG